MEQYPDKEPWARPHQDHATEWSAEPPRTNSTLGVSAFIMGIATWVIGGIPFIYLVVLGAMSEMNGQPISDEDPRVIAGGCAIIAGFLLALIGVGLGIAGCCMKGRKKTLAVLGLIANAAFFGIALVMIVIGLAFG